MREWGNVEIELLPLLCEVSFNVDYAFNQTALRGHIDP